MIVFDINIYDFEGFKTNPSGTVQLRRVPSDARGELYCLPYT
jgi:hypothetical protein